jgi:hypothetical protein
MDGPHKMTTGQPANKSDEFLFEEYKSLLELDKARNERLDRFFTLFLSLAGAPWALYAIVIKDKGTFTLGDMPPLVAGAFLGAGLLGFLVVMMLIQTRFMIVLYMRAVNAIRGHLVDQKTKGALVLPTSSQHPLYYEKRSFVTIGAFGMGLINASYVVLSLFRLLASLGPWKWLPVLIAGMAWFIFHIEYYRFEASRRETNSRSGKMEFGPSALKPRNSKPR